MCLSFPYSYKDQETTLFERPATLHRRLLVFGLFAEKCKKMQSVI